MYFNQIDEKRRTAIYVRISTAMQKTDRQVEELVAFAKSNRLNFDESTDIYKDIISGFKDGEDRPNFSILMAKLEMGEYTQVNTYDLFRKYYPNARRFDGEHRLNESVLTKVVVPLVREILSL